MKVFSFFFNYNLTEVILTLFCFLVGNYKFNFEHCLLQYSKALDNNPFLWTINASEYDLVSKHCLLDIMLNLNSFPNSILT